ncbi:hypothetical protein BKA24_001692 [Microbacterium marinum]|uniref:Uncharacterized protein n=1 Tax=Microbacterium marinum TaxID=421115 RepID=A0A7W7FJB4_9MICO|nr:hypothetical protein [Microbacterium marinum]MBB4666983.1 hypothetical protein [Microbacterium marinum]
MPQIRLTDDRVVDVVKPNVSEKVLAQTQYRRDLKTTPRDMFDVMQSVEWIVMLPVFATLQRHGCGERMPDLMGDDRIGYWRPRMTAGDGEVADFEESEGEQSPDPQSSAISDAEGTAPSEG